MYCYYYYYYYYYDAVRSPVGDTLSQNSEPGRTKVFVVGTQPGNISGTT